MEVYFDYIYGGKDITVGVLIYDGDVRDSKLINVKGFGSPQKYNLDYSLLAFKEALKVVEEYSLDEVTFKNQNQYVFEWVVNENYDKREIVGELVEYLTELVSDGVLCDYEVIKSKDNKVKKELKSKVTVKNKGSFNKFKQKAKKTGTNDDNGVLKIVNYR